MRAADATPATRRSPAKPTSAASGDTRTFDWSALDLDVALQEQSLGGPWLGRGLRPMGQPGLRGGRGGLAARPA